MAKHLTKHSPVDDQRFIVYSGNPDNMPDVVTSLVISSGNTKSIAQGGSYTFPVKLLGSGDYDTTVIWSLSVESGGTIASGTSLDQTGKLTVAATQATGKKLYVTAKSVYGQEATVLVTVTSS